MSRGARTVRFRVGAADVGGLLLRPRGAECLLVLAHGAGAGMRHPFMEEMAARLGRRSIATFRYQFPYMERGRGSPDRPAVLQAAVREAVGTARGACRGIPLLAGGKSMGGRMTTLAAAEGRLEDVAGLVLLGFPLHPAGKPSTARAEHLARVEAPMLLVQGTRDRLADPKKMRPICRRIANATLYEIEDADHSFRVPARAGRAPGDVLDEAASAVSSWWRTLQAA